MRPTAHLARLAPKVTPDKTANLASRVMMARLATMVALSKANRLGASIARRGLVERLAYLVNQATLERKEVPDLTDILVIMGHPARPDLLDRPAIRVPLASLDNPDNKDKYTRLKDHSARLDHLDYPASLVPMDNLVTQV